LGKSHPQGQSLLTILRKGFQGPLGLLFRIKAVRHDFAIIRSQEGPAAVADEIATILRDTMNEAGSMYLKEIAVNVEVKVSDSWAEK
jgi:hypothetical protein